MKSQLQFEAHETTEGIKIISTSRKKHSTLDSILSLKK